MNTTSVIINAVIRLLLKLNYYFEHSLIFRGLSSIGRAAKDSVILGNFANAPLRDYWQGSFILRPIAFVVSVVLMALRRLMLFLANANETSVNKRLFDVCIMPLASPAALMSAVFLWLGGAFFTTALFQGGSVWLPILGVLAVLMVLFGVRLPEFWAANVITSIPARLIQWFFGDDESPAGYQYAAIGFIDSGEHRSLLFRAVHLLLGFGFGLVVAFMPLTWAVLLIGGLAFAIFTFFNLKLSYMLFFLGMLMIPSPMWSNMLILLSAVFYLGVYTIKWLLSSDEKPSFKHISPALVLFVLFCFVSIFTGYGGMDSARVFIIFFSCVVHGILVVNVMKSMDDLKLLFKILAVAVAFTSLFGMYQLVRGIEISPEFTDLVRSEGLTRLYSTLGNPNNDAESWSMLLPFVIAMTITVKSDTKRTILGGVILLCAAAFMLTYSRSGYLALAAGLGVFVLMAAPRLVPVGIVVLLLALPFIPSSVMDRLLTIGQDTSSAYRFMIWQGTMRMIENFWVQGIGMGPEAFIRMYRGYAHPLAWNAMHAHNMFLNILAHSGIGALVAFVAYLYRLFKHGIRTHLSAADKEFKIYMAAGIGALTAFVVFGMAEYVWFYPRVMLVFWLMAGVIMAMVEIKRREAVV